MREGETVKAGQLLAELSDVDLKDATIARAGSALNEAQSTLRRIKAAGRPSEIAAQRSKIANLSALEDMLHRDARRAETLAPTGAGAPATAERTRSQALAASAARAEAEAALETLAQARPEDITLAEKQVETASAQLLQARADGELALIRAPIDGTILRIHAWPGDQVSDKGVLEMANLEDLDIVAEVFETDVLRLREGAPAEVIVPGDPQRYGATVRELGWQVRRSTQAGTDPVAAVDARTVEVRLTLSDAGAQALRRRSNMQVLVAIRP